MISTKSFSTLALLVMTMVALLAAFAEAQASGSQSCASKLTACAQYLGTSAGKPSASCCGPLKEAITNEKTCLCSIYNNPGLLKSFQINITQALNLPKECGIPGADVNFCKGTAQSPSSSTASVPPPGGETGSSKNGGGRITWIGGSVYYSLIVLFITCLVFY